MNGVRILPEIILSYPYPRTHRLNPIKVHQRGIRFYISIGIALYLKMVTTSSSSDNHTTSEYTNKGTTNRGAAVWASPYGLEMDKESVNICIEHLFWRKVRARVVLVHSGHFNGLRAYGKYYAVPLFRA